MASSTFGKELIHAVKTWDKATNSHIILPCPNVVKMYNEKMGSVDICDQMMECYRTFFKTLKWTLKEILALFDLSVVNSWMEYRRDCKHNKYKGKYIMDFLTFRLNLAEYLLSGTNPLSNRGDSDTENEQENLSQRK